MRRLVRAVRLVNLATPVILANHTITKNKVVTDGVIS